MQPYLITAYFFVLIVIGSGGDALMHRDRKEVGHILQSSELALAFFMSNVFQLDFMRLGLALLAYAFVRFALFSYAWNLWYGGVPWWYVGKTDILDKFLSKYPWGGVLFARVITLATGIGIVFKAI